MANLIPSGERAIYTSAIDDIHDTMGRNIIVWQHSEESITTDSNYNSFYDDPPTISYTPISGQVWARIKYIDKQEKEYGLAISSYKTEDKIQATQDFQLVRIKVKKGDGNSIESAAKITVDNSDFRVITSNREHGLFDVDYNTYYLRSLI